MPHGQTEFATCKSCSDGNKATQLGLTAENTLSFDNVYTDAAGIYRVLMAPATAGPKSMIFQVNVGAPEALRVGGGSSSQPASITVPIRLQVGYNSIVFGNSAAPAPDLDRIEVLGSSFAPESGPKAYEAELAQWAGGQTVFQCPLCSGGALVGTLIQVTENGLTFSDIEVPTSAVYELEIDYVANGQHSLALKINDGNDVQVDLNGSSATLPGQRGCSRVLEGWKKHNGRQKP